MMDYKLIVRVPGEDFQLLRTDNLVSALEKRDMLNGVRPGLPCTPLAENCSALVITHTGLGVAMDWSNVEDSERPAYVDTL